MDLYAHILPIVRQIPQARFVVALSGGLDSCVLLALMAHYQQAYPQTSLRAVYVDHGLSPNAQHWAQFCRSLCAQLNVGFDVEAVNLDLSQGSIEEVARQARYQALAHYIQQPEDVLLLGHHADDQLETFFLALKRGSGPKGLSCMAQQAPFAKGTLLRPLLMIPRQQLMQFAREHQLKWVEDESNQDQAYERNFVRHSIVPLLTQRWPSIHKTVQRSAQLCAEQEALLAELLQAKFEQSSRPDGGLSLAFLLDSSPALRRGLLRYWFNQQGLAMPSYQQLELIWQEVALASQMANPQFQLGCYEVRRYQQALYCIKRLLNLDDWTAPVVENVPVILPEQLGRIILKSSDNGQLRKPQPEEQWWLSFNPKGLSAHPLGRMGSRQLKKIFQEYQVPSWLRRQTPILMCNTKVVAVANLFIDRDFCGQDCELIWDKIE